MHNLTNIKMILNNYNCDDWGWYVDTENNSLINSNKVQHYNIYNLYKNININRIHTIKEDIDTYDYFKNNCIDIENLELELNYIKTEKENKEENKENNKENKENKEENNRLMLYKIGSTTLITALITYTLFFII